MVCRETHICMKSSKYILPTGSGVRLFVIVHQDQSYGAVEKKTICGPEINQSSFGMEFRTIQVSMPKSTCAKRLQEDG